MSQDLAVIYSSQIAGAGIMGSGSYNNEKQSVKKYIYTDKPPNIKTPEAMAQQSEEIL